MKKVLITLLVLAVVLVAALLAIPSFIDWNAYKGEIAERVGAATGRTLEINGDVRLALLPTPTISVRDARLSNAQGAAEPDMVRLKGLDARVAVWPLLEGKLAVESVTLVEPVLVTEVLPDGRLNWDLSGTRGSPPAGAGRPGEGIGSAVRFDDVQIRRGTVIYRDASGRLERAENVDARVVANSLVGPFQVQGTFTWRGAPLRGELILGPIVENMAVPLRTTLALAEGDATLRLAGTVGGLLSLNVRAEGGDLAHVAGVLRGEGATAVPPALAQPFALRAVVEAGPNGNGYAVNGLEAQLGAMRATGTAGLRLKPSPDVTLALSVNRLDLDSWLQPPANARPTNVKGNGPAAPAANPLEPVLPADLTGRLDLTVEGIGYNNGLVRQLRVEAALAGGTLNLDRVSALLPGGADIVAAGSVTATGGPPSLDLRVEANADNLRGLLDWLKVNAGAVPPDRLRKAALSARLQGRRDRMEVTGVDLRLDTSRLTGGIAYVDRGRPAFGVRAEVDRLVLDPYLPMFQGPVSNGTAPAAASTGPVPPVFERLLRTVDANLDLSVAHLTVQGLPVQALHLDATANAGTLTVREATVADAAGITAQATGQIGGLAPLRIGNLTFTAAADSLSGLPKIVHWPPGAPPPERIGPVKAQGRVAGDLETLTVELGLAAAGGTLDAGGTLTGLQRTVAGDLKLRAAHPEPARLAALFAEGAAPAADPGPVDLYAELVGSAKAFSLNNVQGMLAGTPLRGTAQVDLGGDRPRVQADMQAGDLDLDRLLALPALASRPAGGGAPTSDAPPSDALSLGWMRGFDGRFGLTATALVAEGTRIERPALRSTLADGVLTLEQLDGELLGGQVGATGRLAATPEGAAQGELNVTLVKAKLAEAFGGGPLDLAGGTLDLDVELNASGASRSALLRGLTGKGALHARDGVMRGVDMGVLRDRLTRVGRPQDALPAVLGALQGGETRFARMDGTFTVERGIARTQDTRLIAEPGEATVTGQVDLPARTVDLRLRVAARADEPLPPVSLRVSGPLDRPTRAFEMQEVQEFLAKRALGAVPVPVPGGAGGAQEMIRGLIEGLKR